MKTSLVKYILVILLSASICYSQSIGEYRSQKMGTGKTLPLGNDSMERAG